MAIGNELDELKAQDAALQQAEQTRPAIAPPAATVPAPPQVPQSAAPSVATPRPDPMAMTSDAAAAMRARMGITGLNVGSQTARQRFMRDLELSGKWEEAKLQAHLAALPSQEAKDAYRAKWLQNQMMKPQFQQQREVLANQLQIAESQRLAEEARRDTAVRKAEAVQAQSIAGEKELAITKAGLQSEAETRRQAFEKQMQDARITAQKEMANATTDDDKRKATIRSLENQQRMYMEALSAERGGKRFRDEEPSIYYRGLKDALNAVNKELAKYGAPVVPATPSPTTGMYEPGDTRQVKLQKIKAWAVSQSNSVEEQKKLFEQEKAKLGQ